MARSIVSTVKDGDPVSAAKKPVEILGGLENAIEKDARVSIKPNLVYGARQESQRAGLLAERYCPTKLSIGA